MILTRKRLLVDIFFTCRLSKSLAFCEFAIVNLEPWHNLQKLIVLHLTLKAEPPFPPPHTRRSEEAVLAGWGPCSLNTRRASKMKM